MATLMIFVEYALNNRKVRYQENGQWFINYTELMTHLQQSLSLSTLDVDLEYDVDLAQLITDIHWMMVGRQRVLSLNVDRVAMRGIYYEPISESMYVSFDFLINI